MILFEKNADINAAYTGYSFKLFDRIVSQQPDKNIIVSPVSVAMVLALGSNGAMGATREAILKVLELGDFSLERVNEANTVLMGALQEFDRQITLTLINSLSINAAVDPAFLSLCRNEYHAEVKPDAPPGALVLTNEIDFKGGWTAPFAPAFTRDELFTLANGDKKRCRMMQSDKRRWQYDAGEQFEIVRLPYGNERISLYVLLPDQNIALSEIVSEFDADTWKQWTGRMRGVEGTIELPRFELEYDISLKDILSSMGMSIAFDPNRANFSTISPLPAYVESVEHRAKINVHEKGTEASARTRLTVTVLSVVASLPRTFHLKADRPFLYVIQDDKTRLPLFMGILADPAPLADLVDEANEELRTLAEALELMVSSMEAGTSFDAAMGKVYETWDNALALAFGQVLREIQLGKPRNDALKAMSIQLNSPEMTAYVNAITEAKAPLIDITRAHARRVREKLTAT